MFRQEYISDSQCQYERLDSVLGVSRHSLRILDQLAANDLNAHELGGLPLPFEVLHSPKKDKLY